MARRKFRLWETLVAVAIFLATWAVLAIVLVLFRACMGDSVPTHIEY